MRLPDAVRSNAVLIGTGNYRSPALRDVPAIRGNLTDLTTVLSDPVSGSFPATRCAVVPDPADARTAWRALRDAADAAEDTLLVYFAGHGLLGTRGELYLTMADTDPEELRVTGLEYDVLREVVSQCGADNRIVILDCCFSGRAVPALGTALSQTAIEGTYVLASAPPNGVALAPDGAAHTAFTGELITLLRDGVPEGPELLGLGELYRRLLRTAVRHGLPRPVCSGTGTADLLALARNAATGPTAPQAPRTPKTPRGPSVGHLREPKGALPETSGAFAATTTPFDAPATAPPSPTPARPSRRRALASMAAVAVTGAGGGITAWKVLERQGNSTDAHAGGPTSPSPSTADTHGATANVTPTSSVTTTPKSIGDTSARRMIARTTDIPVGGGLIIAKEKIVVTQPEQGSFHAFRAVCTHSGCPVSAISKGAILCPCHGSTFDMADGSVLGGPATTGLYARQIEIHGDSVMIAADT